MLLGKVLGWIPSPWSGVRLGTEVSARLCTDGHPLAWFLGDDRPWPKAPPHIHVTLRLWNRTEHRTTVREVNASAAGQRLVPEFREMTLDPGAKPEEQSVQLEPSDGEALKARPGDAVSVELLLTRGRTRKLRVRIEPEKED
jgi:hypothetical protein